MEWIGKILLLPVEEFDEEIDGRCDSFLRLGAARVPLQRDDLEGRHFTLLPKDFNPQKHTIVMLAKDAPPNAEWLDLTRRFMDVSLFDSPSTELRDAARLAIDK